MRIPIFELAGKRKVLAGSIQGKDFFAVLIKQVPESHEPEILFLDFTSVEVATASFLREAIIAFRDYCRSHYENIYPVIANAPREILDEIMELAHHKNDAFIVCRISDRERVTFAKILGKLDEKQRLALRLLIRIGSADAGTMAKKSKESEDISVTAWNNRLSTLNSKGIATVVKRGRAKVYRPILEFSDDGY